MTTITEQQKRAAILTIQAIAETIREAGEAPEGPMYAALMGRLSLDSFQKIMGMLERTGLIRRGDNHVAVWIGPKA